MATVLRILLILSSSFITPFQALGVETQMVPFHKEDLTQRTTECEDQTEGCAFLCRALRCKNELFMPKTFNGLTASGHEISVNCESPLSCIGVIRIDGLDSTGAFKQQITCGSENESCRGGIYQFYSAREATFLGNARESVITFKKVTTATIRIDDGSGDHEQKDFFQNQVFTEAVHEFHLEANALHSASGIVLNLLGVEKNIRIKCFGFGSCAGTVVIVDVCTNLKMVCRVGACQSMLLVRRRRSMNDCPPVTPKQQVPYTHIILKRGSEMLVFCEKSQKTDCVPKQDGIKQFNDADELRIQIIANLDKLQKAYEQAKTEAEKKEAGMDNLAYVLRSDHTDTWGGVSLESAIGGWIIGNVPKAVVSTSATAAAPLVHGAGSMVGPLASVGAFAGHVFPLALLPLVIPLIIFTAKGIYERVQMEESKDKWSVSDGGGLGVILNAKPEKRFRQYWQSRLVPQEKKAIMLPPVPLRVERKEEKEEKDDSQVVSQKKAIALRMAPGPKDKMKKEEKEDRETDANGVVHVVKKTVDNAREEYASFYGEDVDNTFNSMGFRPRYLDYDYNDDGSIMLYDFFTGKKYDPNRRKAAYDAAKDIDLNENMMDYMHMNGPYRQRNLNNFEVQRGAQYSLLLPLVTIVLFGVFCLCCFVFYGLMASVAGWFYLNRKKKTNQYEMVGVEERNHVV